MAAVKKTAPPPEWAAGELTQFVQRCLSQYSANQRKLAPEELDPLLEEWREFRTSKIDALLDTVVTEIRDAGYIAKLDKLPDHGVRLTIELSLKRSSWVELTCAVEGGQPCLSFKTKDGDRRRFLEVLNRGTFLTMLQGFVHDALFRRV